MKRYPKALCYVALLLTLLTVLFAGCGEPGEVSSKSPDSPTEITMLCWALTRRTDELVLRFNESQDQYKIVVESYVEKYVDTDGDGSWSVTEEEMSQHLTRMFLDVLSGNHPDLYYFSSGLDSTAVSYAGLLQNLNVLINNDPDFNRDDFHPTLWRKTEIDGALYEMACGFTLEGIAAPEALVGDRTGWTIDDYYALEAQAGEPLLKEHSDAIAISYAYYGLSDYIDLDNGTCSFDSPAFRETLEFLAHLDTALENAPAELHYPVRTTPLSSVKDWAYTTDLWQTRYQVKPMLLGYPQAGSAPLPCATSNFGYKFGVSADTEHLDGCWAFLKFMLSEEVQTEIADSLSFPVRLSVLEDQLSRAALPADNPKSIVYEWRNSSGTGYLEPLTEEDVSRMRTLLYDFEFVTVDYIEICNILMDEAAALFAGDKTVEETAALIQNRASLFLAEQHQGLLPTASTEAPEEPISAPEDNIDPADLNRMPIYPDAGYTIEDGAVILGDRRYSLRTTTLNLSKEELSDFRFLAELTELNTLVISISTESVDLSPLAALHQLSQLSVYSANVTAEIDFSPLAECENLTMLYLEFIKCSLDSVGELTHLKTLILGTCQFDDVSFVANLTELERLTIIGRMSPEMTPLLDCKLPKLEKLQVPVYPGELEQLKLAFPGVDITGYGRTRDNAE